MSIAGRIVGSIKHQSTIIGVSNAVQLACTLLCVTSRRLCWDADKQLFHLCGVRAGKPFSVAITADDLVKAVNHQATAPPPE